MKNIHHLVIGITIVCFSGLYSLHAAEDSHHHDSEHAGEDSHHHDSEHAGEKRQLDSHQHGVSTLKIALEGQSMQMELESPANDIVGFEHAPENNKQKADIENALSLLQKATGVFIPSSEAECITNENSAEFEIEEGHSETHSGFHVIWKLTCSNPKQLKNLETTFFELFPKAHEIEVEIISASGQKAIEWESDINKIKLPTSIK